MTDDSLVDSIYGRVQSIGDWCSREKVSVLLDCITRSNPAVAVEIGVFSGQSAFAIGLSLKTLGAGVLFAIDPWTVDAALEGTNDPRNDEWWSSLDLEEIYRTFIFQRESLGLSDTIEVLKKKSDDAATLFHRPVDFLHIDGNHSEEVSTRDVSLWLPKTSPGAFIVFDDTDWSTTAAAQTRMLAFADEVADYGGFKVYRRHDG